MTLLLIALHAGVWDQVQELRQDGQDVTAIPSDRADARVLVAQLSAAAPSGVLPNGWQDRARAAGFEVAETDEWVRLSCPSGVVFLRVGPSVPLILQAPHAWFDRGTGALTAELFEEGTAAALMVNTGHRYGGDTDAEHVDVAHADETLFQAATLGVVEGRVDPLVVQLHGFSPKTSSAAAVVSQGAAFQSPSVLDRAQADLIGLFGDQVVTDAEVPALAGRRNLQGRVVGGTARFLHIELSQDVRAKLAEDDALRAALGARMQEWAQ
jgi:hypothetical protein